MTKQILLLKIVFLLIVLPKYPDAVFNYFYRVGHFNRACCMLKVGNRFRDTNSNLFKINKYKTNKRIKYKKSPFIKTASFKNKNFLNYLLHANSLKKNYFNKSQRHQLK